MISWQRPFLPLFIVLPYSLCANSIRNMSFQTHPSKNVFYLKPSMLALDCSKSIFELVKKSVNSKYKDILHLIELDDANIDSQMDYDLFDCILFTGKSETARLIKSKVKSKKAVYETGSSAMAYISTNSDIKLAVENITKGAFDQNGMRCVGAKNVFIHSNVYNEFLSGVMYLVNKLNCGDIFQESTDIGPLRRDLLPGLKAIIDDLIVHGYIPITGGQIERDILLPTVLYDDDAKYFSTMEAFGPIQWDQLSEPDCFPI
jgi:acyl-CoA reductase-like NAD-dependent aldehyde dehydrogenase